MASGVDFFVGMTADGGADFVGLGDVDFLGPAGALLLAAGVLLFSGAVGADFSVDTETLGSVAGVSETSGAGAGVEASSCAQASGAAARTNTVRARMVIFI